jgi:hypothetical protein
VLGTDFKPVVRRYASRVGSTPTSFRHVFSLSYECLDRHVPARAPFDILPRNELRLSRRHLASYKLSGKTPEPRNKKEEKTDICHGPIVADGYLGLEPNRIEAVDAATARAPTTVSGATVATACSIV